MKILTRNETAAFLAAHDHYRILTHIRPDGDTIGSAAALCRGLRQLGKDAFIVENRGVSDHFRWLHEGLTMPEAGEDCCIVSVDVASPGMLPQDFLRYMGSIELRIDHHGSATSFTEFELVDAASASCAEVIYDVLTLMGCKIDTDIAEAIYVGASTDTGCFRFANTTAHTFRTAAACAEAGARVYQLNQDLFETNTLARLRMQSWVVDHMKLLRCGSMAVCAIPRAVELQLGVDSDDMDNISNFPRTVAGVNMAVTLRETESGEVKISVRAIPGYDAAKVAEKFGGGGHKGAAGATMRMTLSDAALAVEQAMLEVCQ